MSRIRGGFQCVTFLVFVVIILATFQLYIGFYEVKDTHSKKTKGWLRSAKAPRHGSIQHPQYFTVNADRSTQDPQAPLLAATNANFSSFRIIHTKQNYEICDELEILIEARNSRNQIKTRGGDFLFAWLHDDYRNASVAADAIIDHQNGSYTGKFTLHWGGVTKVSVLLIHASETVQTLRRVRAFFPARFTYKGMFRNDTKDIESPCHMSTEMYLPQKEMHASTKVCNFTDGRTNFPWFCLKPNGVPCESLYLHSADLDRANKHFKLLKSENERRIYKRRPGLIKSYTTAELDVDSSNSDDISRCNSESASKCTIGIAPKPPNSVAGFYYRNSWYSSACKNHQYEPEQIQSCLSHHKIYFLGDSSLRQWYFYLTDKIFTKTMKNTLGNKYVGPHFSNDGTYNTTLIYRFHGLPVRVPIWANITDIQYIPNVIDNIQGGSKTVIILSLWAHFTSTPVEYYRQRWRSIKSSLVRLRIKNQGVKIFVKSANTREPKYDLSNWYALELDVVMRQELLEMDFVTIIDSWDMTIGHHSGYNVHPDNSIVSQEVAMWLSFMC